MIIIDLTILYNLGLEERDVSIYLAILDIGRPSVKDIQSKIKENYNLSYSQTYYSLKKLLKHSLIEEHASKENTFTAINPDVFLSDLRKKRIEELSKLQRILGEKYRRSTETLGECTLHMNHFYFSSLELGLEIIVDKMIKPAIKNVIFIATPPWILKKLQKTLIEAYDRGLDIEIHYSNHDFEEIDDYLSHIKLYISKINVSVFQHKYRTFEAMSLNDEYTRTGRMLIDETTFIDFPYYYAPKKEQTQYLIDYFTGFYQIAHIVKNIVKQLANNPLTEQKIIIPEKEAQLLSYIKQIKNCTKTQLAEHLEMSGKSLNMLVERLSKKKVISIEKSREGKGRPKDIITIING